MDPEASHDLTAQEYPIIRDSTCNTGSYKGTSDWREKVHSIKERNLTALKNSILTDITLEMGPENTPFTAHKLILALGSPVFETMFYGPLAEQGEKITIPDIIPDDFKVLLKY
ncbi:hypothetical protein AVEN_250063-1 [Araneus ventricosus]|uniref:BTB domain-containing protein n=1 Tax=Araneus ventricosus TaxID=182803 RepID=A0A4Y2ERG4_ARAVE|nr:hypothetical protein AVEN_250063-1 [Araneus ventricosus]